MKRFLAIGECMIEMAPDGSGLYTMKFAGDTFNTAWYARQLASAETEVAYLSAVGDDAPSEKMTDFMRESGVIPELAVRTGGNLGLYMVSLQNGERSFSYWRSTAAARTLADDLDTLPGLSAGDMAFFSGISIAILPEAGRRRLLDVLAKARAEGVQIVFDPNLRPRLWKDTEEMCHWITEAAKVADIAMPSFEDEETFFGDADIRATSDRYRAAGARLIVTKDGSEPVLIMDGDTEYTATPCKVDNVVDTTAAGDAFNAGFLMALSAGATPGDAAQAGCDLASKVVTRRGALVDLS